MTIICLKIHFVQTCKCILFIFSLSILALQDVHVSALRTICDELNNPKLQKIRDWNNERYWNFCMLDKAASKLGFIYDSQGGKCNQLELSYYCKLIAMQLCTV